MTPTADRKHRVLVADDDESVRGFFVRLLELAGYEVTSAVDGSKARDIIEVQSFDVIVSDISMPGITGVELLRTVRERDLDVPVVLVTGSPTIDTAMRAVQYGALRYLQKPVEPQDLLQVVAYAARVHDLARAKRQAFSLLGQQGQEASDLAGLETTFGHALESMQMAYQPILSFATKRVYAYEALMRPQIPSMPHPGAMLDVAERLGRVHDMGRCIRESVSRSIETLDNEICVFVNLHPHELTDDTLYSAMAPLSKHAKRVVLEITERAQLEQIDALDRRTAALRAMGYRFAVDDLGTGYAGLSSFVHLHPEIVKLDMGLVRDVHINETKARLIQSIQDLCGDMEIQVVGEGVECAEEWKALTDMGVNLLQGFVFARPATGFVPVSDEVFA